MKPFRYSHFIVSTLSLVFFIGCQNSESHSGFSYTNQDPSKTGQSQSQQKDFQFPKFEAPTLNTTTSTTNTNVGSNSNSQIQLTTTTDTITASGDADATSAFTTVTAKAPDLEAEGRKEMEKFKKRMGLNVGDIKKNLGFLSPSAINDKVTSAAASVVKIVIPDIRGEMMSAHHIESNPKAHLTLNDIYQQLKDDTTSPSPVYTDPALRGIHMLEIKNCINRNASKCKISVNYIQFSGFITGDGSEVTTSFQNLETAIKFSANTNRYSLKTNDDIKNLPLSVLIFSGNGDTLIDETKTIHISDIPEVAIKNVKINSPDRIADVLPTENYARLNVGSKIGDPIAKAKEIKVGQSIINLGYPAKTETSANPRAKYEAPDSDGHSLYATQGTTLSMDDAQAIHGGDWGQSSDAKARWEVSAIFTDADGAKEMSGGPVLNENGEYVGIFTGSSEDIQHKLTYGISIKGF